RAQNGERSAKALAAEHLGRRETGRATADDHDTLRFARGGACVGLTPLRFLHSLPDDVAAISALYTPTVHRHQCGSRNRLARTEIEAGVMPRAAHRFAHHHSFTERPAVVRALGVDGEHLRSAAGDEDRLRSHMAYQHSAIRKKAFCDSGREIGTAGLGCVTHGKTLRGALGHYPPPG